MKFEDTESPLRDEQIDSAERELGLRFPKGLREHFLRANGGRPEPYVYRDENVDTAISECLPLRRGKGSAIDAYERTVLEKKLVPREFFPFAMDGGGDFFYVDCSAPNGLVYLHQHDTAYDPLIALGIGIDEFWSRLTSER